MNILRQSTQVNVHIGPVVAVGDGYTPVTNLVIGSADEAEILKADATTTTDISGATLTAITNCDGYYYLTLTTSHTDTVGTLTVCINDDSLCLPVMARFQVMEEAVYDALYGASATGFDANGRVDVGEWLGTAVTLSTNNKPDVNVDEWGDVALSTTDPLPNAVPGASGGLLIAGTNAATTFSSAGTALTITSSGADALSVSASGGNGNGVSVSGNGTADGIVVTGGTTGNGVTVNGGATSGHGVEYVATDGDAIYAHTAAGVGLNIAAAGGLGHAIKAVTTGTAGAGMWLEGQGSSGYGLYAVGDVGRGIYTTTGGTITNASGIRGLYISGDVGLEVVGNADEAVKIYGAGTSNAHGVRIFGDGTGDGVRINSGSGATGNGVAITASSTDGDGITVTGSGTGNGVTVNAGATGAGVEYAATSGTAFHVHTASGDAFHCHSEAGVLGCGIKAEQEGSSGAALWLDANTSNGYGLYSRAAAVRGINTPDGVAISNTSGTYGMRISGPNTYPGLLVQGGGGATGNGLEITCLSTDGTGVVITGTGTGNGMTINAGATGDGLDIGATSGQGTYIHSASGHGLQCEGTGVLKSGIWAYATGSASNGLKCEGAGIGIDCSGAIGIDVDGSTTYGMKIAGTDDALFIQGTGANSDAVRLVSTGTGVDINGAIDITAISGSTTAADNIERSSLTIVPGTVSNAVTSPTTTLIPCSDITEATADHYIGRVIIFDGDGDPLRYQAAPITDYELVSGEGRFTVKEMTEAPANGDTFIIV